MKEIKIYTDGSALRNPGPAGWGAILIYGKHRRTIFGGFKKSTNNRMEIYAVIAALEALNQPCKVTLWSDSQYVVNAISKNWIKGWQAKNWRRKPAEPVPNADLWQRLLLSLEKHQVTFKWVRGHSGNHFNEIADQLANQGANQPIRPIDTGYGTPAKPTPEATTPELFS